MMTLITGGSKCGKSRLAENILDSFHGNKIYIATMRPYGEDAHEAIARHRKARLGKGFETLECYSDLDTINIPHRSGVLLECMGNLCANEMFSENGDFTDPTDSIMRGIKHLKSLSEKLVIVTNNVGSDGINYDTGTNEYIRVLGRINILTAEISDNVIECVYGITVLLKGKFYDNYQVACERVFDVFPNTHAAD